jgi:hypothetical protein
MEIISNFDTAQRARLARSSLRAEMRRRSLNRPRHIENVSAAVKGAGRARVAAANAGAAEVR